MFGVTFISFKIHQKSSFLQKKIKTGAMIGGSDAQRRWLVKTRLFNLPGVGLITLSHESCRSEQQCRCCTVSLHAKT